MTRARTVLVVGAGVLAFAVTACNSDKLTNLNKNPNSPEDVPPAPLFTFATQRTTSRYLGGYSLRQTEFLIQHQAEVQYPDEDTYKRLDAGSTQGNFDGPYFTELEDFTKIIAKGKTANDGGIWGPAEVMRAWTFSYLTNTWGDIPYSEALKGDSPAVRRY